VNDLLKQILKWYSRCISCQSKPAELYLERAATGRYLFIIIRRHRWKATTPIAIDDSVPWAVCLSVNFVHCAQTAEDIDTIFCIRQPHVSPRSH